MEKLQPNSSYHIFNHANGFENIFTEDENFRFFLDKYNQYILPIAETYAYCLLPNHFHLVVRIRRKEVLEEVFHAYNFSKVQNFGKVKSKYSATLKIFIDPSVKSFTAALILYTTTKIVSGTSMIILTT